MKTTASAVPFPPRLRHVSSISGTDLSCRRAGAPFSGHLQDAAGRLTPPHFAARREANSNERSGCPSQIGLAQIAWRPYKPRQTRAACSSAVMTCVPVRLQRTSSTGESWAGRTKTARLSAHLALQAQTENLRQYLRGCRFDQRTCAYYAHATIAACAGNAHTVSCSGVVGHPISRGVASEHASKPLQQHRVMGGVPGSR